MKANTHPVDEARLGIMLNELRLPTIKTLWPRFAEQSDREGWPAARFLAAIAEHELAERAHRRVERHLAEAHLPPGGVHPITPIGSSRKLTVRWQATGSS